MKTRAAIALAITLVTTAARADEPDNGRFAIGGRVGSQSIYLEGDGSPSDLRGFVFGVDGSMRVGRYLAVATSLEASLFDQRSDRLAPGPTATSYATFLEARVDTNPDGPWSARIDLGAGCRWLALPLDAGGTDHFRGIEPLRLHVGPTYRAYGKTEVSLLGGFGFGWFTARSGAQSCAVTATCADSLFDSDTQSATHFVLDLSIAIRGWI